METKYSKAVNEMYSQFKKERSPPVGKVHRQTRNLRWANQGGSRVFHMV